MIKKHYFNPKDRAEWLRLRTMLSDEGKLGGSDIAVILNANPWKSAIELFYNAVGFSPRSTMTNQKMHWGTELEDKIIKMYQYYDFETEDIVDNYENGLKVNTVRNVNAIVTNSDYPYLFANIDTLLPDINGIGEAKNMSGFVLDMYKEPNTHLLFANCPIGIPVGYYAQLQQYMMVFKKKVGRFLFLRDGSQLVVKEIKEDLYLQEQIQIASIDFATRVQKGKEIMDKYPDEDRRIQLLSAIEPEVNDGDSYNSFRTKQLEDIMQHRLDNTMIGTKEQFDLALEYANHTNTIKEAKKLQTLASNQLKTEFFKNRVEVIDFDADGKVSFKKRLSVSVKAGSL